MNYNNLSFILFKRFLAQFRVDKHWVTFYIHPKPVFCHYQLKTMFLLLLQLRWNTMVLQHVEYVHVNRPAFLCGAVKDMKCCFCNFCFHLLLWVPAIECFLPVSLVVSKWSLWKSLEWDFTSPISASALGSKFQFAGSDIKLSSGEAPSEDRCLCSSCCSQRSTF